MKNWQNLRKNKKLSIKQKWMRNCLINISSNCKIIFDSNFKRTICCQECNNILKKIGITIERYRKMVNEGYNEESQWIDDTNCKLKMSREQIMYDGETPVGSEEKISRVSVTFQALEDGLNHVKKAREIALGELDKLYNQQNKLGKKPIKTDEMIRLIKNLEKINVIKQYDDLDPKIENRLEEIKGYDNFIEKRNKTLNSRPTKNE